MHLILHNPLSKNKKSKKTTKRLVDYFKKNNISFKVRSYLKIDKMDEYLNKFKNVEKIIFLGGDGSINHLVNKLIDQNVKQEIYLIKNGSGNDFFRSLFPKQQATAKIAKVSFNNEYKYFANGCGIGADARIVLETNKSKLKNKLSYYTNTIKGLIKYKKSDALVIIDGKEYNFKNTYLVVIQNGKYFGGGMKITPDANIEDEYLDIIVVHKISKPLVVLLLISIYFGLHTKLKKSVFYTKGKNVEVYMKNQILQTDGEPYEDIDHILVNSNQEEINFKVYEKK